MSVIKTTIVILRGTAIHIQLSSSDACAAKVLFLKQTLYFLLIYFLYYSDILNCTLVDECHVSQLRIVLIITVICLYSLLYKYLMFWWIAFSILFCSYFGAERFFFSIRTFFNLISSYI